MTTPSTVDRHFLSQPQFWLLALLAGLYAIYMTLAWRAENVSHVAISLLFGCAVFSLLQDKQHKLNFGSSLPASLVGTGLVLGVLGYSATQTVNPFLRLLPILSGLGVGLLASGFRGLKQYRQELIALFFLGVPSVIAAFWIDISPITAIFSRLLLLYTGFEVSGQGTYVALPTGSIKVVYDCSGIDQMNYLLGLSVLSLVMFPLKGWMKQVLVPLVGLVLGFFANVIRVAMMAIFAASNKAAFDLWHTGEGSYIFAFLAVLCLGLFYRWLLKAEELVPPSTAADSS
ncbi:cyanoexosortase A [Acaryochloris sp. IP29b_bin.148]|uniref:cyanoexosortase A n=1 Tax=Acaryochloris sp. IP29b_bin.148 TaxID=2969218 RepID=UPI00260E671E|nr:cyanoexosortase A [Acaryochloris sp. IP29b_bin.148]